MRQLLLEECGYNLSFLGKVNAAAMDRFRFAVLKVSGGNMEKLCRAVQFAQQEWRDLLLAAGFANSLDAHKSWLAE